MSKKIIDRYVWLIETVAKAGDDGITYKDINKHWMRSKLSNGEQYPIRTFHNHRGEISDIFSIVIACNSVNNTYYVDTQNLKRSRSKSSKLMLSFLAGLIQDIEVEETTETVKPVEPIQPTPKPAAKSRKKKEIKDDGIIELW